MFGYYVVSIELLSVCMFRHEWIIIFANFFMLNYPCYMLAGWLDLLVVAVVPTIHHRLNSLLE